MQVPDEEKRERIRRAAVELFARKPYHRVLLSEVAAAAGVGKGTIYVYFENKQELYLATIFEDFRRLVEECEAELVDVSPAREALRAIVRRLVNHAFEHTQAFELMRTAGIFPKPQDWMQWYRRLVGGIESVIRRGIREGDLSDPRPDLTALFIPGFVRSAIVYGPERLTPRAVSAHILRLLEGALTRGGKS